MADVGPRQFSGGMNDYALSYKLYHATCVSCLFCKTTLIIIAEQTA